MKKSKFKKRNPYVLPMLLHCKSSAFSKKPFKRLKNKLKKEVEQQLNENY